MQVKREPGWDEEQLGGLHGGDLRILWLIWHLRGLSYVQGFLPSLGNNSVCVCTYLIKDDFFFGPT